MDNGDYNGTGNYPRQASRFSGKRIVTVSCAFAVVIALFIVISAFTTKRSSTLLTVNVSDKDAKITLSQPDHQDKDLGVGNARVRVDAGAYVITASHDNAKVSKPVKVVADQTNNIDLTLQSLTEPKAVAEYSAQNIFADGNMLQFLNVPFHVINSFAPGDYRVDTIFPDIYPVNQVYWLNSKQAYIQATGGDWYYVSGDASKLISQSGQRLADDTISYNKKGAIAYIDTAQNLVAFDGPQAVARKPAEKVGKDTNLMLADNGDILLYTPKQSYPTDQKPTRIYRAADKSMFDLPSDIEGIDNASLSPDGSAIAYTTSKGIGLFNIAETTVSQITSQEPDSPKAITWLNTNSLIYAQGQYVWQYQPSEQISKTLARITGSLPTSQPFYINNGAKKLYYGTVPDASGAGGNIYSIDLP